MALVVDDTTVIHLDERRPATEARWPVGWTILLVTTLSVGLWATIVLSLRYLATFMGTS